MFHFIKEKQSLLLPFFILFSCCQGLCAQTQVEIIDGTDDKDEAIKTFQIDNKEELPKAYQKDTLLYHAGQGFYLPLQEETFAEGLPPETLKLYIQKTSSLQLEGEGKVNLGVLDMKHLDFSTISRLIITDRRKNATDKAQWDNMKKNGENIYLQKKDKKLVSLQELFVYKDALSYQNARCLFYFQYTDENSGKLKKNDSIEKFLQTTQEEFIYISAADQENYQNVFKKLAVKEEDEELYLSITYKKGKQWNYFDYTAPPDLTDAYALRCKINIMYAYWGGIIGPIANPILYENENMQKVNEVAISTIYIKNEKKKEYIPYQFYNPGKIFRSLKFSIEEAAKKLNGGSLNHIKWALCTQTEDAIDIKDRSFNIPVGSKDPKIYYDRIPINKKLTGEAICTIYIKSPKNSYTPCQFYHAKAFYSFLRPDIKKKAQALNHCTEEALSTWALCTKEDGEVDIKGSLFEFPTAKESPKLYYEPITKTTTLSKAKSRKEVELYYYQPLSFWAYFFRFGFKSPRIRKVDLDVDLRTPFEDILAFGKKQNLGWDRATQFFEKENWLTEEKTYQEELDALTAYLAQEKEENYLKERKKLENPEEFSLWIFIPPKDEELKALQKNLPSQFLILLAWAGIAVGLILLRFLPKLIKALYRALKKNKKKQPLVRKKKPKPKKNKTEKTEEHATEKEKVPPRKRTKAKKIRRHHHKKRK